MDKEEFRVKLEEINHLVEIQDYKSAMDVVDSIDWRRVKNVRTLCVVGEIYAANKRYEDSREIFILAYHRASIGKNVLSRLIEVSLKMDDIEEAEEYYQEFMEVAPNDNTRYILKYKIEKAKNAPIEEQIKILEEYKKREFTERWSYELARLYYRAGEKEKCLDVCNEMSIWFNDGKYVMKALELKLRLGHITDDEKEKYERQFEPNLITPEQAKALQESESEDDIDKDLNMDSDMKEEKSPVIESIRMDQRDINNAESFQEKISKGIRDIFGGSRKSEETDESSGDMEIQEEMIKDISSKEDYSDVPSLEPEKKEEKKEGVKKFIDPGELGEPEDKGKVPNLNMPEFIKDSKNDTESEIPSMPEISVSDKPFSNGMNIKSDNFNLEDTILAAATEQGIEIPEKSSDEKQIKKKKYFEEEDMTEEDLQKAEEEFLNGPDGTVNTKEIPFLEKESENLNDDENKEDSENRGLSEEEELERFIESINPSSESDRLDIIPRKKELTDNEKKLFTYLAKVPGLEDQLLNALCDAQEAAADKTSVTGNIIVMGGRETGKTRLISGLIPAICEELHIEASKVAYVFAEQINGKDITSIVNKLAGGFLVIENVNQLAPETVEILDKAMEFRTDGLTVIIEDEKIGMRKFIAKYPKFAKKFTSMINIPVFTNDELVNFAKIYTKEKGYIIDQMGMLALYNLISVNQKEDEPMNIGAVKNMIDAAIVKSQGGIRKLKRNLSKKRTDRDGFIVLYEKDFA